MLVDRSAEARLVESLNSNYGELAVALVQEIANPAKPFLSRSGASLFFKNTLNARSAVSQVQLHARWKQLDPKQRNIIKETLLQAITNVNVEVSHETSEAKRFAAIAASEVACVELPYQEWPQFLPTITAACTAANTKGTETPSAVTSMIQIMAYHCLGLTCERIEEVRTMEQQGTGTSDLPYLPEATINAMLTTIVQGITQPSVSTSSEDNTSKTTSTTANSAHEIQLMAMKALSKSLLFVHSNMERKEERDFIILHAICNIASQHNDHRIRHLAYECLDVIAQEYYDKLLDYMSQIFQLTVNAIQTDPVEEVKIVAIEFWNSIAEIESNLLADEEFNPTEATSTCKKYVESAMAMLVPLFLDGLSSSIHSSGEDEEYDEDEYDVRAASGTCIENFALTVGNGIVPLVMPFVQQNIVNMQQHWSIRDAAIVAFSCILNGGPTTEVLGPFVHQSISVLLSAFNDPHPLIRDDATHCISNISREHIAAVQPDQVHAIVQACIMKLQESTKLAARAATVIFNLSTSIKSPDATIPDTNVLSLPMLALLQALLAAMDRSDSLENNLRVSAGSAASELILASANDVQPILRDLLPAIMGRIEVTFQTNAHSADDRETKEQLLGLLCGLITPLYQKLPKAEVLPHTDKMMSLLLQVLQVQNANCHEEALRAIGAIASALDEDFNVRCRCEIVNLLSVQGLT
jgi:importin subunit beta-1